MIFFIVMNLSSVLLTGRPKNLFRPPLIFFERSSFQPGAGIGVRDPLVMKISHESGEPIVWHEEDSVFTSRLFIKLFVRLHRFGFPVHVLGEGAGMIAWVFLVYLGVWLLPVWLPVLVGVLMPGLRTGPRAVLVLSGLLTGLYASGRRVDSAAGDLSSLVVGHVSTLVLSACLILSGFCLVIVHRHVRDRKTCTPADVLSLVFLSATVPVWWWLLGLRGH